MKEKKESKNNLITAEQLSIILGISEFTVKKLARSKEIPCNYVRGKIVFSIDKVLARFKELEGGAA